MDIEKTLIGIDTFLRQNKIEYAIIGGVAAIFHGRLRTTEDIDITLLAEIDSLEFLHSVIVKKYIPVFAQSLEFFEKNFVLPVTDPETNVKVDFAAGMSGFDKGVVNRNIHKKIGNAEVNICSLEDLILYKLFAARPIDLMDVEELINKKKSQIDLAYMESVARGFIELERDDVLENLERFLGIKKSPSDEL